ncbi:hypothetical protein JCGZ_26686 [Jatropha curcas]|uniref:Uncharacterized protein n=1 Tax=Jatropha curcas TaxID=180498 RepID=A0A067L7E8_JATCU|nr:hypothetical protein JCGZ_26686 [Jatropha curcas]
MPVDYTTVTGLPLGGQLVVFDDQLRTLDLLALRASLQAAIEMELDVDVVTQAFIFYLLLTTLFTNHSNDADSALLPP